MKEQQIILNGLTVGQFLDRLEQRIKDQLESIQKRQQEEPEQLLTVQQVAELLQTTPQNIHAKKRAGKIPFVRFGGRILFKRSEVIASLPSVRIDKAI